MLTHQLVKEVADTGLEIQTKLRWRVVLIPGSRDPGSKAADFESTIGRYAGSNYADVNRG